MSLGEDEELLGAAELVDDGIAELDEEAAGECNITEVSIPSY